MEGVGGNMDGREKKTIKAPTMPRKYLARSSESQVLTTNWCLHIGTTYCMSP